MGQLLDVLRTEKKYPLNGCKMIMLSQRLRKCLPLDEFCKDFRGYTVRSVYFDSISNADFFQKEAGIECRKKIRLRSYGGDSPVKLEWKQKQGALQRKRSLMIKTVDIEKLIGGDYKCLLAYEEPIAREFYTLMVTELYRPRSFVQYQRQAFTAPVNNTRITLDSDLRVHEGDFSLLKEIPALYPVSVGKATLEVKYNRFLPSYVKEILSPFMLTEAAESKYYASRNYGLGGKWQ